VNRWEGGLRTSLLLPCPHPLKELGLRQSRGGQLHQIVTSWPAPRPVYTWSQSSRSSAAGASHRTCEVSPLQRELSRSSPGAGIRPRAPWQTRFGLAGSRIVLWGERPVRMRTTRSSETEIVYAVKQRWGSRSRRSNASTESVRAPSTDGGGSHAAWLGWSR